MASFSLLNRGKEIMPEFPFGDRPDKRVIREHADIVLGIAKATDVQVYPSARRWLYTQLNKGVRAGTPRNLGRHPQGLGRTPRWRSGIDNGPREGTGGGLQERLVRAAEG